MVVFDFQNIALMLIPLIVRREFTWDVALMTLATQVLPWLIKTIDEKLRQLVQTKNHRIEFKWSNLETREVAREVLQYCVEHASWKTNQYWLRSFSWKNHEKDNTVELHPIWGRLGSGRVEFQKAPIDITNDDGKMVIETSHSSFTILEDFCKHCCMKMVARSNQNALYRPSNYRRYESKWSYCGTFGHRSTETLFLEKTNKNDLFESIDRFLSAEPLYQKFHVAWHHGILLTGPPGTGKTSVVYTISSVYKMPIYWMDATCLGQMNLVRSIPPRSVVVFDDIDVHFPDLCRSSSTSLSLPLMTVKNNSQTQPGDENCTNSSRTEENSFSLLGSLMEIMDGKHGLNGCIVFAITNHPEKLDSALKRPGRFNTNIKVDLCSLELLQEIFRQFFPDVNVDSKLEKYATKVASSTLICKSILPTICTFSNETQQSQVQRVLSLLENTTE